MGQPKITRLPDPPGRRRSYRLEGGELAPAWADFLRPGDPVWCEITVWDDPDRLGADLVGSYRGSVWPPAWPELFESIPATVSHGAGGVRITYAGRAALEAAS